MESAQGQLSMSKSSQGEKEVRLQELSDEVFSLKQQLETSARDLEANQLACQERDRKLGKLETQVEQKKGELHGMTGAYDDMKKHFRTKEEELSQLQTQLAKVKILSIVV